jgi:hypothetical protein
MTNSVTFPTNLGGDGSTVTDDDNATTGLGNGGHRTRFVPAMGQTIAVANTLTQRLANNSDTSSSSVSVGTGTKNFTTAKFYTWAIGMWVTISSGANPSNYMHGQVTSYNSGSGALVVDVNSIGGSGTMSDWTIALSVPDAYDSFFVTKDSDTGSAAIPAGTTAQRTASPGAGDFRFNSTLGKFEGYNGSAWGSVGGGATGGGSDAIFIENGQNVTTNYTITTNYNAGTFGPVTIDAGITVTVPSGSVWTIV